MPCPPTNLLWYLNVLVAIQYIPEHEVHNDIYKVVLVFARKYGLHKLKEHLVTRKDYGYFILWTQFFFLASDVGCSHNWDWEL